MSLRFHMLRVSTGLGLGFGLEISLRCAPGWLGLTGGGDHGYGPGQLGAGRDPAAQDGAGEDAGNLVVPAQELLQDSKSHHERVQELRSAWRSRVRQRCKYVLGSGRVDLGIV